MIYIGILLIICGIWSFSQDRSTARFPLLVGGIGTTLFILGIFGK